MACENCGSVDTSEDIMTREHTCLKCGHVSKGVVVNFLGTVPGVKNIRHQPGGDPFRPENKIYNQQDFDLLK